MILGPNRLIYKWSKEAELFSVTESDYVTIHMQSLFMPREKTDVEKRWQRGDRGIRDEEEVWGCEGEEGGGDSEGGEGDGREK